MSIPLVTTIAVDPLHLFSVRVTRFDVASDVSDIVFELQADKTRASMDVRVEYGKFPTVAISGTDATLMTMRTAGDVLKPYDVVKDEAWRVVLNTTATNGPLGAGTHASVPWEDILAWVASETSKPSIAQTVNTTA